MKIMLALTLPLALFCTPLASAGEAGATDVMTVAPDHYTVLVDNAHVRVVKNTLAPGEKDGMHTHAAGWF